MPRTTRFPDVPNQVHVATAHYNFALDGGVAGEPGTPNEIVLPGTFPAGALFFNGICHILTSLVSGGGFGTTMIGLKLGDMNLVASEEMSTWNAGLKVTDVLNATNGYNPALLDEDANISITIEGDTLEQGKMAIHLMYIMSPAEPEQLMALSAPEGDAPDEEPPPEEIIEDTPKPEEEPEVEAASFKEQPQRRSHHRKKNEDEE